MTTQISKKKSRGRAQIACCQQLADAVDVKLFRALSDPTRVELLLGLSGCCGALSVGQAAECCAVDLSVVSRHLAILRDAGLLRVEKQGRTVFYEVRYAEIAAALRRLADAVEACCPGAQPNARPSKR